MKTRWVSAFCVLTIICTGTVSGVDTKQTATQKGRAKIYDESADGAKQITDAIQLAKKNDKHALLQFGANWCVWCIKLHRLYETNETVWATLKANYVVALIDVNERNEALPARYRAAEGYGLPFIVVLDNEGRHLVTKNTDELEEGDHHNPQKVLAFLNEWTPKVVRAKTARQWVKEFVEIQDSTFDPSSLEFERIRERADEAVPVIIDVIRPQSGAKDRERIRAYRALGGLGAAAKSALPFLAEQFTTNNTLVQYAAATIPKLEPDAKAIVPRLTGLLCDTELSRVAQDRVDRSDPRSWLQWNAAIVLSKIEPRDRVLETAMIAWLKSPNTFFRRGAPRILGEVKSKSAVPALKDALGDPDETVRQNATNALAEINLD